VAVNDLFGDVHVVCDRMLAAAVVDDGLGIDAVVLAVHAQRDLRERLAFAIGAEFDHDVLRGAVVDLVELAAQERLGAEPLAGQAKVAGAHGAPLIRSRARATFTTTTITTA